MLQVNVSGENTKGGVAPDEIESLLTHCALLTNLKTIGLMAIPAPEKDPGLAREPFRLLRELRDALQAMPEGADLEHLSMGMSSDFELAIEEGATMVRIGHKIFGERKETK